MDTIHARLNEKVMGYKGFTVKRSKYLTLVICLLITAFAAVSFWTLPSHDFVGFDDDVYVTENTHVQKGLTGKGVLWAFSTTYAEFWHPLTWLSHMLDCELFGLRPGMHHVTSLLLHMASSVLLLLVLRGMTGALWRSAFVAALFALHPLHVEPVAWIADRKDVLSTFFWFLTMGAYVQYVRAPGPVRYFAVMVCFFLGLMAKPMLVTLPFVLLLLDYWPLGRVELSQGEEKNESGVRKFTVFPLIWEKAPLFALTFLFSVVAYVAQQKGGGMPSLDALPLGTRIGSVLASYAGYIGKMVWPGNLAVCYPFPETITVWQVMGSGLLLSGLTIVTVVAGRRFPYLAVGWFWYIGTLVPVIGLVKVGIHGMADRYTYVPLIGLFIMISWGAFHFLHRWRHGRVVLAAGACAVIFTLIICTRHQVDHWKNTTSLFKHALAVTSNNYVAHYNLGVILERQGRLEEAISHLNEALRIRPNYALGLYSLGNMLGRQGRVEEAVEQFLKALRIRPDYAKAHFSLGVAMERLVKEEEALAHYRKALLIRPGYAEAHNNLGAAFARRGNLKEAVQHFSAALGARSGYAEAHNNLGLVLARLGRVEEAMRHYGEALKINPHYAEAHNNMGGLLAAHGRLKEAIPHFYEAIRIEPDHGGARHNLELVLRQMANPHRHPTEADGTQ